MFSTFAARSCSGGPITASRRLVLGRTSRRWRDARGTDAGELAQMRQLPAFCRTGGPTFIGVEVLLLPGRFQYGVEDDVRGQPPDERCRVRRARAGPLLDELRSWCDATLPKLSAKSELAGAIRYARARWPALLRYRDDGRLEIDNNAAERALRGVGRKN
jgi:transposase IS66 family protein